MLVYILLHDLALVNILKHFVNCYTHNVAKYISQMYLRTLSKYMHVPLDVEHYSTMITLHT